MFKRSTKITSLLVAAASVASMVPAYAADYKKIDTQDGTVYNAVAYKDGQAYIDAEVNGKDEADYYYKDGKYTPLDNIDAGADVYEYGTKYVETGSKNDGDYYVDLTSGKVTDEQVAQNNYDDASSALKRKVKKDNPSRYTNNDTFPVAVDTNGVVSDKTVDDTDTMASAKISGNKFADEWYQVSYDAKVDADTNASASSFSVYTDNSGNYIDADYNLGRVPVITTSGSSVDVKNTNDDKNDARVAVRGIRTIGQDKDYIYRLAKVVGNDHVKTFGTNDITAKNNTTSGAGVTFSTAESATAGDQYVIQKISKAQDSSDADGAKYAKNVYTYFVTDDSGNSVSLYDNFTVNNGKIINYERQSDNKIHAQAINLKTKGGYNYTDLTNGDSQSLENDSSYDYDVDGNLYALEGGYIYKFNNDDNWDKVYKVDGAFDKISVYDQNNMVLWSSNTDDEVYSVIGGKDTTSTDTDTTGTTGTTTTTAQVGWVQNTTDGSWGYYENGAKVTNSWRQTNGTWYFLNADGVMMSNGWLTNGGAWYYLAENGAMKTGWIQAGGNWYYLAPNGAMKTGWFQDTTGTWYYANESGAMLHDTTVGGYTLGSNGALV